MNDMHPIKKPVEAQDGTLRRASGVRTRTKGEGKGRGIKSRGTLNAKKILQRLENKAASLRALLPLGNASQIHRRPSKKANPRGQMLGRRGSLRGMSWGGSG